MTRRGGELSVRYKRAMAHLMAPVRDSLMPPKIPTCRCDRATGHPLKVRTIGETSPHLNLSREERIERDLTRSLTRLGLAVAKTGKDSTP